MERRNGLLIGGLALGAGLMYLLDPAQGRRRRALMRDKLTHARKVTEEQVAARKRDAANRSRGLGARLRSMFRHEQVDDRRLEERVRAKLGRVVSSASPLEVHASTGVVQISGTLPAQEREPLLRAVQAVPGVRQVVDELTPQPSGAPTLQGAPAH